MDAVLLVDERLVVRSAAVHRIEVEPRSAEVHQSVRVVVPLEPGRRVEREVVIDELPEVREARGDVRVVARGVVLAGLGLGLDHLLRERLEVAIVRKERREVPEHPSEPALEHGRSEDDVEPSGLGAMEGSFRHERAHGRASGLTVCLQPSRKDYQRAVPRPPPSWAFAICVPI